jgi:hypothetical protein
MVWFANRNAMSMDDLRGIRRVFYVNGNGCI